MMEKYTKKIEQIKKTIFEINNNLDRMYMDKIKGIIQEEDYIRISGKFNLEKIKLKEQIKSLELKLNETKPKLEVENKLKEKEADKLIENFLKLGKIEKTYLYRLINKIEIDKDKNVYIYFNFSKPKIDTYQ